MDIVNRDSVEPFATKDTSLIREILNPRNSGAQAQSLAEATLPPGAMTQAHYHPRAEEFYYVLQGDGLLWVEAESRNVTVGDAVVISSGQRHQICNTGSTELIFLCCCSPAYEHEDTVLCEPLSIGATE